MINVLNTLNNDITNIKAKEFIWRLQEGQYYDALQTLYEYNEVFKKSDYISQESWDILFQLLTMCVLMVQDRFNNKENLIQMYNNINNVFGEDNVSDFSKDIWLKTIICIILCAYYLLLDEGTVREGVYMKDFEYTKTVVKEQCNNESILKLLNSYFDKIDNEFPFEYDNIYTIDDGMISVISNVITISNCFK